MIMEMRTYTLTPGGVREYLRLYNEMGRAVQCEILGDLVTLMQPESDDLNQLVFLWRYETYDERVRRRRILMEDERFTAFRKAVRPLMVSQHSRLLTAV